MALRVEKSERNETIVVMRGVVKSFDDQTVLNGIDLDLDRGETLVVLGASGSGKSVLLSCLVGLMKADMGRIEVFGEDVTKFRRDRDWHAVRKRIGYLFQGGALFDSMTIGENVAFPARNHGGMTRDEIRERVEKHLALVGLEGTSDKMPSELSGGMQKRAALARALALEPELIVYDEPTTGLDPIRSDAISRLIRRLQTELNTTAIVVTHDMACAETVADRVELLHEGSFVASGSMTDIRQSNDPYVRSFVAGKSESAESGCGDS